MILQILALLAVAAAQAAPAPLVANGVDAPGTRLHIGDTGIRCVRFPCPSRAVFEPTLDGLSTRDRMLYVDMDGRRPPPPMIGDPDDLSAIEKTWEKRQCLAIEGRLIPGEEDRPVLRVDRLLGPCHQG